MSERTADDAGPAGQGQVLESRGGRAGFDVGKDVSFRWHGWLLRWSPPQPQPSYSGGISVGSNAEFLRIIEPTNPARGAADAGVVENRCGGIEIHREIGGIDTAMEGVAEDCAGGLGPDSDDAVGDDDWSGRWRLPRVVTMPQQTCFLVALHEPR